jgi:PAS domain S-box-containing protein
LGRPVREAIPDLEPAWLEAYDQVARTGRPVRFESYAARLHRWFQVFAYTPGERLLAVLTFDVTERTAIQGKLRKSEQQFRTLTENIPFIVARFDHELRHLYINPAIEAVAGRPVADFLGRTNEELGMPAELVAFWNGKLREAFERGWSLPFEFEFPTAEGNRIFVSTLVPERNAAGEVETVLSVVVDITTQRRGEQALKAQLEELRGWHEAMLGRESRIMELKREVNDLRERMGQPPRYRSVGGDSTGGDTP